MSRIRKNRKQNSETQIAKETVSNQKKIRSLLKPKTKNQEDFIVALADNTVTLATGPAGSGKALTLDSKLFTKFGSVRMRDVKMGDEIANPDGGFSKVTGIYPQGKKVVHRVFFSNGCYVDCCEDHLWKIRHNGNGSRIVDTKFLMKNCRRHDGKRVISIPCTKPVSFERKEYIIDPYFMGIIISEGSLANSTLCFTSCEEKILERVGSGIIEGYTCKSSSYKDHRLVKSKRSCRKNIYIEELRSLGLWGRYAHQKHIPENYKYGSVDQRIALLQGLMDGDGIVSKEGALSYCTTSFLLIKDFCELVHSLGGTTRIVEKIGSSRQDSTKYKKSYKCHINLPNDIEIFFLSRKKKRVVPRKKYFPKLYVDRVEKLGEKEMQCISVDHKDHLYLTDNYITTHNTKISVAYGIEKLLNGYYKRLIVTRPVVEAGPSLGYLPGPQPLDAKLLTPNGWTTMGEINVGDFVISRDGLPTKVLEIYPKGKKDVYNLFTSDGTSTSCCKDHLWYTQTKEEKNKKQKGKVRLTKDIMSDIKNGIRHFIPRNEAVHFEKKHLPIPPYTLGVMLGDGCVEGTHVRFSSADQEIVDRVNDEIKVMGLLCKKAKKQYSKAFVYTISSIDGYIERAKPVKITEIKTKNSYYFPTNKKALEFVDCGHKTLSTRVFYGATVNGFKYEKNGESWKNPVLKFFKDSGLYGKKAWDKFIPFNYKYSSIQDRIDILRGLLDTDGSCRKRSSDQVNFYTTSISLAEDVIEIVRSLGGKAKLRIRDRRKETENNLIKAKRISYEVSICMTKDINPFYIKRKAERFKGKNVSKLEIISIKKSRIDEVQCIMVENPEHLYITDNFIVTHNTFSEKLDPYLQPIYYELSHYISKKELDTFINNGLNKRGENEIIIAPLAYMRGMNYHESYMILDECQNCTKEQIKLFVTRVGMNSKAVLVGDDKQSDLPEGQSGLYYWKEKLKGIKGVATIELDRSDIIRNEVISRILQKIGE